MKLTAIEAAVGVALVGSVLAVAVPAFVRNLSSSRLTEVTSSLGRLGSAAIANASGKACTDAFPPSAPMTPTSIPRGKAEVDAEQPDPWQQPTWRALDFRPTPPGVAHWFSYQFDNQPPASFLAHAHGDLDGDGTTSTFEVRGACTDGTATLAPGMYVEAELE
jgi:type II secretory pathway pseudopilin PulG